MSIINTLKKPFMLGIEGLNMSQILVALGFRIYLANVFFSAGLVKIKSWQSTLDLFAWEYAVPVVNPVFAAYSATAAELILPVMLVLGFGSRIAAAGLFILNFVAAISYPDISPAGVNDHYFWGAMLLTLLCYGPGKASVDEFIQRKVNAA